MTRKWILKEAVLPLEVIILFFAGLIALITGIVLFPVSRGALPYYENGVFGIFLVLFALQMLTLGKTPFGDVKMPKFSLSIGILMASIGVITCFIPDLLGLIPRILLFICFGLGGFCLLIQLFFSKEKYQTWVKYGGIFHQLIIGCVLVYTMSILIGLLVLKNQIFTVQSTALLIIIYGTVIIYLAYILGLIYAQYPEAEREYKERIELSTDKAMILMMCIFMTLLGLLLIPVSFGIFPFSVSAQLGLLMFLFAIQMLALGSTPIGPFPRTRLMVLLGLLFATLGIISCIIPDILVVKLTILVGVLNVCSGVISLGKLFTPLLKKAEKEADPRPPILRNLFYAQLTMGLLSILFGISMLISNLIPGLIVGIILAANGFVLLYLLHILILIDKMTGKPEPVTE